MSDADNASFAGFGKMVPGFDFLQNLAKQATAAGAARSIPQLPSLGHWIAPTINVEELDKRIQELKAVQFWLDQNAAALKATIQALEVQKMTLATLKGMNFNMSDMASAFTAKVADAGGGGINKSAQHAKGFSGLEVPDTSHAAKNEQSSVEATIPTTASASKKQSQVKPLSAVDPMQWWGALTQQFQKIADSAMQDVAKSAALAGAKNLPTGLAEAGAKKPTGVASSAAGSATRSSNRKAGGMAGFVRSTQAWPTPNAKKIAAKKVPVKPKPARKGSVGPRKTATPK